MPIWFDRSAWICSTSLLKARPSNGLPPSRSLKGNCPAALMFNQLPGLPETTSSISFCFVADWVSFSFFHPLSYFFFLFVCLLFCCCSFHMQNSKVRKLGRGIFFCSKSNQIKFQFFFLVKIGPKSNKRQLNVNKSEILHLYFKVPLKAKSYNFGILTFLLY